MSADPAPPSGPSPTDLRRREILAEVLRDCGIRRSVIVTGSFRSGSSYVCTLLAQNGLTGTDKERFASFWDIGRETPEDVFRVRLTEVLATAEGGLFTTKLMWPHRNFLAQALGFGRTQSAGFAAMFPDARWIDIRRQDKIAQAISFWKAKVTNRWHVFTDEPEPEVSYDFNGIRAAFVELSAHDLLWEDFHVAARTNPWRIVYESFAQAPVPALSALLEALGPRHRHSLPPLTAATSLRRQSNAQSKVFRARFLSDLYSTGF